MKITVINNRKEEAVVEIPDDGVLLDVKKAAEKVWGIPVNKQNITRGEVAENDADVLNKYYIREGSFVRIHH
ncbi:hypothetical protein EG68_02104 [Paragonimus skrjabini miyazakii]|uniref:Ubiquitin-like domain-containing protein n=1 Tax=Paragonimus skrjabini miyazakii TaxID=59628 RepID=A0A8S9Z3E6_9TREM|nr:hypothetical protein EG68_02104 [Paragonimus skrjabini miyazakii]